MLGAELELDELEAVAGCGAPGALGAVARAGVPLPAAPEVDEVEEVPGVCFEGIALAAGAGVTGFFFGITATAPRCFLDP